MAVTGTLALREPSPSVGDVVHFDATVVGKPPRGWKVEVAILVRDAAGAVVLQGVTSPGNPVALTGWTGAASGLGALRVVDLRKSGVQTLAEVSFTVNP